MLVRLLQASRAADDVSQEQLMTILSQSKVHDPSLRGRTAGEGADTITWLAAAPEAARVTGMFWLDREPHTTHVFPGTDPSPQERQQLDAALARLTGWQGKAGTGAR